MRARVQLDRVLAFCTDFQDFEPVCVKEQLQKVLLNIATNITITMTTLHKL